MAFKVKGVAVKGGSLLRVAPPAAAGHVHGPGCNHDHGDHAGHDHAGHDHAGHAHEDHDHSSHVHGPSCNHDHDHHDHHDHGHEDDPPRRRAPPRAPEVRPAETGGAACQLDLAEIIPGERDDVGRFQKLEQVLEIRPGIGDVHLRKDAGRLEICVHYDAGAVALDDVVALVRSAGDEVSRRYRQKSWFVRGMDSAQCATVIEFALNRAKGVLSANVAYAAERLVIEYDTKVADFGDIDRRVRALGFELETPTQGHACSHHHHGGGLAPRLELPLGITAGVLLAAGFALELAHVGPARVPTVLYAVALIAGGYYALRDALNSLRQLRFDIETLMVLAAVGAAFLGAWFEGALLLFLFSLGHALEHRAMQRARTAIEALGKLRPEAARVRRGADVVEVPVGDVRRGDRVLVRAGDRVPLDGVIREGRSALDQATVTGESVPVAKGPGDTVFAGTINTEAALEVEVTRLSTESALARVIDMVTEAEAQKSPTQRFTARIERRFVPLVLALAPLLGAGLYFVGHVDAKSAVLRAISLLVAASPCALAISTPSAVLTAVARAARGGVLMKGGAHLEALGRVHAIAFDKTGTLTMGRPRLLTATPAPGATVDELLAMAAGAEAMSSHPLARAVVEGAKARGVAPAKATGCEAVHGRGIRSRVGEHAIAVGSVALFDGTALPVEVTAEVGRLEAAGQTTMVVQCGARILGVLGVADTLRPEAKEALASLRALGITRTVMLSGDNLRVAKAIGAEVGIDEPRAPLMPEGKVAALRELAKEGGVGMVGDGVNDAPALAAASVGITLGGAGSDVALETADVVLMADDLRRLPFAVGLARAATGVIQQNVVISLGVSALLIVASVMGWVRISHAVVLHEGSTLVVVANALRLLGYRE